MGDELKIQVREKCERVCATLPKSCRQWLEKVAGQNNCTISAVPVSLIDKARTLFMCLMG